MNAADAALNESESVHAPGPDTAAPSPRDSQLSTLDHHSVFARCPGETPRAFNAFAVYFQLGHSRTLQGVSDELGENLDTVKRWSSRFRWAARIHTFSASLLHQQAQAQAATRHAHESDWQQRIQELREKEWIAAQKLMAAAQCFLENFGEQDLQRMSLAGVSRALQIASQIARHALTGSAAPDDPTATTSALQLELAAALKKIYGQPASPGATLNPQPLTLNPHD